MEFWLLIFFGESATRQGHFFTKEIHTLVQSRWKTIFIAIDSLAITSLKRFVLATETQVPCHVNIYCGDQYVKFKAKMK